MKKNNQRANVGVQTDVKECFELDEFSHQHHHHHHQLLQQWRQKHASVVAQLQRQLDQSTANEHVALNQRHQISHTSVCLSVCLVVFPLIPPLRQLRVCRCFGLSVCLSVCLQYYPNNTPVNLSFAHNVR